MRRSSLRGRLARRFLIRAASLVFSAGWTAVASAATGLEWNETQLLRRGAVTDEHVEATFTFRNNSSGPIEITRVESSCGCMLTSLAKQRYEPGEGGELRALVDVTEQEGTQEKTIMLWSSSGGEPDVLSLQVTMPRWFTPSPPGVWWLKGAEPHAKQVELKLPPEGGFRITSITTEDTGIELTDVPSTGSEPRRLIISPVSTDHPMRALIKVVVETHNGARRSYHILAAVR